MKLSETVAGKIHAARSLQLFIRSFRNWSEVWSAYRTSSPLPPFRMRNGLTLFHGEGDDPIFLFREIFELECYVSDAFYQPKPTDRVLDLGGNIGVFALFLESKARGIKIQSFEPATETRRRYQRNIDENRLGESITVHPYAVSNVTGVLHLKQAEMTGKRSLFSSDFVEDSGEEEVHAITLDEALRLSGFDQVDLLKVDIEGAEVEVFEGASPETLRRMRRIILEYHDRFRPGCRERVSQVLTANGFQVETFPDPGGSQFGMIQARPIRDPS